MLLSMILGSTLLAILLQTSPSLLVDAAAWCGGRHIAPVASTFAAKAKHIQPTACSVQYQPWTTHPQSFLFPLVRFSHAKFAINSSSSSSSSNEKRSQYRYSIRRHPHRRVPHRRVVSRMASRKHLFMNEAAAAAAANYNVGPYVPFLAQDCADYETQTATDTHTSTLQGRFGTLHRISLAPTTRPHDAQNQLLRPGEDPIQYERTIEFSTTTTGDRNSSSNESGHSSDILCLHRFKIWWMKPQWVSGWDDVPVETMLALQNVELPDRSDDHEPKARRESTPSCHSGFRLLLAVPLPLVLDTDDDNTKDDSTGDDSAARLSFASASLRGRSLSKNKNHPPNASQSSIALNTEMVQLCSNHPMTGLYRGFHPTDPYALIQDGVAMATSLWPNQQRSSSTNMTENDKKMNDKNDSIVRTNNTKPTKHSFIIKDTGTIMQTSLGWCTWNAFYTNLSAPNIVDAVVRLKQDIPIRWMIVDDGWQDSVASRSETVDANRSDCSTFNATENSFVDEGTQWSRRLNSLQEEPRKFQCPWSLKDMIAELRKDGMLDAVLVWHTLAGYWLGLQNNVRRKPNQPNEQNSQNKANSLTTSDLLPLPPSQTYYPHFPRGILDADPTASHEASVTRGIGIPDDPSLFYHLYHTYLAQQCGVNGVKVDAQAVTGVLKQPTLSLSDRDETKTSAEQQWNEKVPPPSLGLQSALTNSVLENFVPAASPTNNVKQHHFEIAPVIHCMAHSPEIFYRLPSLYTNSNVNQRNAATLAKPFFRVADDYYPNNEASHGAQIVACAFNSLILGQVAIADWDMFMTTQLENDIDGKFVRMHAIAKCLSGGPIYVSDSPKTPSNLTAIEWICTRDGTTFPCRNSALPVLTSLFKDPLQNIETSGPSPFVIWNTNGHLNVTNAVLGAFHLGGSGHWDASTMNYARNDDTSIPIPQSTGSTARWEIRPSDVPIFGTKAYKRTKFLGVCFFSHAVHILLPGSNVEVSLDPLQSEAVAIYPFVHVTNFELVVLGLLGQINGAGSIQKLEQHQNSITIDVNGCGQFILAVRPTRPGDALAGACVSANGTAIMDCEVAWATKESLNESQQIQNKKIQNLQCAGFDVVIIDLLTSCHQLSVDFLCTGHSFPH